MSMHKKREDVIKRLARIEGHVRGVRRMVEEGKSCPEVLLQLAAVRAALSRVGRMVFEDHVETCVSKAIKEGAGESAVAELKEALARFL
jgi:DNA-binding FrmR family transcriptional regulator